MEKKEIRPELLGHNWNCAIGRIVICENNYDLLVKVKADVFVNNSQEPKAKTKKTNK